MSTKRSSGLVGDSSHTIRVCGVIAFSTASTSEASTGLKVKPKRFNTLSKSRNVPPYTSSMYTTWSPGLSSSVSVLSAPIPEEKARQCFAPSRAASREEEIRAELFEHTLNGHAPEVKALTEEALSLGMDPMDILFKALIPASAVARGLIGVIS